MISAGIDAGTKSYEIFWLDDDGADKITFPTEEVRENPGCIVNALEEIKPDVAAGLSGYGLPVKAFQELNEEDISLMTLSFDLPSLGLREVVNILKTKKLPVYTIPAVIHLPTVPAWRKINRIDMGTYDKLCSAILALYELSQDGIENFVLVEAGFGFNAFISVRGGRIVDGIGGTSGFPGYSSSGCMDGELAYLLREFPKSLLFRGGISELDVSEKEKMEWLAEFTLKGVRAAEVTARSKTVAVSGRMFENRYFFEEFNRLASEFGYEVRGVRGFGTAKQSAEGAAIAANGIAGGRFSGLVKRTGILDAKGTVFDYLTPEFRTRIVSIF